MSAVARRDIRALKARVDFRELVAEDHAINRSGKVTCPFHDERHPSCHIYPDGFKCFGCGAYGDHLDWLEQVDGMSTRRALERLEALAQAAPPPPPGRAPAAPRVRDHSLEEVNRRAEARYRRLLARTRTLPAALAGRGLSLREALELGIAARGDDALLPIRDPLGRLVALKWRYGRAGAAGPASRYAYSAGGHGGPAWCAPHSGARPLLLVVEGELNGMVAWLALREAGFRVGVMGTAGASGTLYPDLLRDRTLFLIADADAAGEAALQRWRVAARRAGARSVVALPPWREDACEVAGRRGRAALAARLRDGMFGAPAARPALLEGGIDDGAPLRLLYAL